MNSSEEPVQKLFASAAASLLRNRPHDSESPDVGLLLEALGYAAEAAGGDASLKRHRALLLRAASRFSRVFQLAAPDAPGLVSFGAEFDPAIADSLHAGNPLVGVSGVGLSLQEAFQGCIGEGIEYLSQLQAADDALLPFDAAAVSTDPRTQFFLAALAKHRTAPDPELAWCRTNRLTDRREFLLPADWCLRRPPDRRQIEAPFALSTGSGAGPTWQAAALHGLLELIERDAASLWWRGGSRPGSLPPQHEARVAAESLLSELRQGACARRSWLLDITTDVGVPCVVSASCFSDGHGFTLGLAARATLQAAARSAVLEMCQMELALAVVDAKRRGRGEAALNERDRTHLRRATLIDANACALLQTGPARPRHLLIDTSDPGAALQLIAARLEQLEIEVFALNLTRTEFEIPVARVLAPALQLEPSDIIMPRLSDMIAQTGGGMNYNGGIALI